jgi:membrane associated rhomboid family serine protease
MPEAASSPPGGDPAREPIYRAIRWLMAADVLLGLALAAFGGELFGDSPSIRYAGAILALIGAALFLLLGRLARQRRDQRQLGVMRKPGEAD